MFLFPQIIIRPVALCCCLKSSSARENRAAWVSGSPNRLGFLGGSRLLAPGKLSGPAVHLHPLCSRPVTQVYTFPPSKEVHRNPSKREPFQTGYGFNGRVVHFPDTLCMCLMQIRVGTVYAAHKLRCADLQCKGPPTPTMKPKSASLVQDAWEDSLPVCGGPPGSIATPQSLVSVLYRFGQDLAIGTQETSWSSLERVLRGMPILTHTALSRLTWSRKTHRFSGIHPAAQQEDRGDPRVN